MSIEEKHKNKNLPDLSDKLNLLGEKCIPDNLDISGILAKTEQKINEEKNRRRHVLWIRTASVAASLVLLLSAGFYFLNLEKKQQTIDLKSIAQKIDLENISSDEIVLITSEKELVIQEDAVVQHTQSGDIIVGTDLIAGKKTAEEKLAEEYNHLLVPRGKRTRLTLPDGTLLWINSLSKVVYPQQFAKDKRQIYVQGEVYMEVALDEKRPFIVTADDFSLEVLGTKFNISNYESAPATEIVLVEGSVQVTDMKKQSARITPNSLLKIQEGVLSGQSTIDVRDYVSWIHGLLVLHGNRLADIVTKLNIYYDIQISYAPSIADEKVYGKLDLKDDVSDVLDCLSLTLPIQITESENQIYLNKK